MQSKQEVIDAAVAAAAVQTPTPTGAVLQFRGQSISLTQEQLERLRSRSLFIATPCYGGMAFVEFMLRVMELGKLFDTLGVRCVFRHTAGESLISRARNTLSTMFLAEGYTHMLFIDSDIKFSPLAVLRMLLTDCDIVGAIYPQKAIREHALAALIIEEYKKNPELAESRLTNPDDPAMSLLMSKSLNYNINILTAGKDLSVACVEDNDCAEVSYIATGFMMIKREVLLKMRDAAPENSYTNDVLGTSIPKEGLPFHDWFSVGVFPKDAKVPLEKRRLLSEDWYFCQKALDLGYKVYAMTRVPLGHIGLHHFQGCWTEKVFDDSVCQTFFDDKTSSQSLFAV